jgi:hypothetical protein
VDRRRVARQAQALQDGPDNGSLGDHGDESAFPRPAVGALEHVHVEGVYFILHLAQWMRWRPFFQPNIPARRLVSEFVLVGQEWG